MEKSLKGRSFGVQRECCGGSKVYVLAKAAGCINV